MIPRADFGDQNGSISQDRFSDLRLEDLKEASPTLKALRKPDFQRETNHWTPSQVVGFVESFLDDELVPAFILWDSKAYIYVIDGGHRLSALRAWIEDDYGDREVSNAFYKSAISEDQKRVAKATRILVDARVGRYNDLRKLVANISGADEKRLRRANRMFRRTLTLQWVNGEKEIAESSFFKINSQGTPLDAVETSLIKNRRKPIAIGARAIVRAGEGHKYWADFSQDIQTQIVNIASAIYGLLFEPEVNSPIKTLDVPLGGSVSPVDALALLVDFLVVAGRSQPEIKSLGDYADDLSGEETVVVLRNTLRVIERMTSNKSGSLGLHPAVYYYSEKAKHSRFLFLGIASLITEWIVNNNSSAFIQFTHRRKSIESFMISNKSLIMNVVQNINAKDRVRKMRDMFAFLVKSDNAVEPITVADALSAIGVEGRFYELNVRSESREFSDETKSQSFVSRAIKQALQCPVCGGLLHAARSVSYDHKTPVHAGGSGSPDNCDLTHPFCNTAMKGGKIIPVLDVEKR